MWEERVLGTLASYPASRWAGKERYVCKRVSDRLTLRASGCAKYTVAPAIKGR